MLRLLFVVLAVVQSTSWAADPSYRHVVRLFTMNRADGLELLARADEDSALFKHLEAAAKTTPEILERLIVVTSGDDAEIQATQADEFIYPTEFDPQQLPQTLAIGNSKLVGLLKTLLDKEPEPPAPLPQAGETPKPPPAPAKPAARHPINQGLGLITSITPTAFEMRPLGETLDLKIRDGGLSISLRGARLAGLQNFNGELQAQFSSREINTSLPFKAGEPVFLGTFTTAQKSGSEFENRAESLSLAFFTSRLQPMPNPGEPRELAQNAVDVAARLEVLSVPKSDAVALIDANHDDAVLYTRLKTSTTEGPGRLEVFLSGRARLDEETTIAETDELIYAVEFDPPQVVSELVIADDKLLDDLRAGRQTGTGAAPPAANPHNGGFGLQTAATPTGFETRHLGARLTLEVDRRETGLRVRANPDLGRLVTKRTFTGVQQPVFGAQQLATTRPARLGVPLLLGTLNRALNTGLPESEKEDRIWFSFLTLRD